MNVKRGFYYLAKFTLLDELLGFIYWAIALLGLFELFSYFDTTSLSTVITTTVVVLYVVLVTVVYIYGLRRLVRFFKKEAGGEEK